jgi:hypothetical protein
MKARALALVLVLLGTAAWGQVPIGPEFQAN